MLSEVSEALSDESPSTLRNVVTVEGSSWPMPTAPVEETAPICHPDSHQQVPSSSEVGTPKWVAHCWNNGTKVRRLELARRDAGYRCDCRDMGTATEEVRAGRTSLLPTRMVEVTEIPLARASAATEVPLRVAMDHRLSPGAATAYVPPVAAAVADVEPVAVAPTDGTVSVVPAITRFGFRIPLADASAPTVVP